MERRPRSDSKVDGSSNEAELSSTSSPGRAAGTSSGREKFSQRHQHLVAPIPEPGWNTSFGPLTASPAGRGKLRSPWLCSSKTLSCVDIDEALGPFVPRNFSDFSKPIDGHSPWDSPTYLTQSPLSMNSAKPRAEDMSSYWRFGDSPGQNPYAHSQYHMPPTPMSSSSYSQTGTMPFATSSMQDDNIWAPSNPHLSMRSMSMVGPEELPSNSQSYHYANFPTSELKRRPTNPSDMPLAPSLHNSGTSSAASTTESLAPPSLTPLPGAHITSQQGSYSEYQGWPSYPDPQHISGAGHENFGSWYPDTSQPLEQEPNVHFSQTQMQFSRPG